MARNLPALLFATALLGCLPASAQTLQPTIPTGTDPSRITVNPVTNRIYVSNYSSNTVSVIDGATNAVVANVPVGARPTWVAANPETNKVYISNAGAGAVGPSLMVLSGATNAITSTLAVGDVGWTAINEVTNKTYVVRFGNGDEVNIILDERYVNTAATRSYQPVSIALNPYTNVLYIVHQATGDVVAIDARVDQSTVQDNINNYPPLLCPNGAGGYRPSPGPTDPDPGPCINISDPPTAVTVNPVTDMIYSISPGTLDQIGVIRGSTKTNPHTVSFLTPPGVSGAAKTIAVNPVANKVYAIFANHIVIVNGADNAMTVIPSNGAVAIGVNTTTNTIYVPHSDGTLKVISGATNAVMATLAIPTGATSIAVNPVTNMAYVVTPSGVTPVVGASATAATIPLTTTITPLAGDSSGASGSITMNASASGGFAAPRRVYFQIDSTSATWQLATGSGPYTASFAGLANGSHTIRAFATNALDAMSIMTDVQNNPLVGAIASYTFTVGSGLATPSVNLASSQNPTTSGQGVTFTASVTGSAGAATGTVSFLDGATTLGGCASVVLSSGAATCTLSSLAVGTHSISAQYAGNSSYNPGTSSPISQVVKASSAVVLSSSLSPSTAGQSVAFTANVTGSAGVATGTVNFLDGAASIAGCAAVALSSGSATCATAGLSAGSHSITAQYSGSGTYNAATSAALTQTVNAAKVDPAVGVSSSLNPSTAGQSVTFTASVTGSAGVATGTVNFVDGASSIAGCSAVTLSAGSASCATAALSSGSHSITAQYSGNSAYNSAPSPALTQTVNAAKVNPAVGLSSSLSPSTAGQSVAFTANVTGSAGVATGTVNFLDGATSIAGCAAVALSSGSATCATAGLSAGSHSITAQYSGSGTYNAATSAALTQTVNAAKVDPAVGVSSSLNPSTAGQSVTFTANVTGSAGVATGTVNFLDGAASIAGCAAVALSSGSATCATAGLSAGSHSITAQYSGSGTYNAATSAALTQTVNAAKVDPAVGVSSSLNPSTAGQSVTFTASVTGSAGAATGTVNFLDGALTITGCSAVNLAAGSATCATASLSSGSHSITVQYSGNSAYNSATSTALTQSVNGAQVNPTVGLSSSVNPSTVGQSVTFTANVGGSSGAGTGTINFLDGAASIPGCGAVTLSSGSAACVTNSLTPGSHSITASYSGNASYNAGSSSAVTQTVAAGTSGYTNVAMSSAGAVASASSELSPAFSAFSAINGERAGVNWGNGGGWAAARANAGLDLLQVNFAGAKTIDRVVVFTVQDAWNAPSEPTDTMTFTRYGVVDFVVEGWNGSSWATLGTVTGNNLVKRTVAFAPFTTSRIRVRVIGSVDGWSRIVELEAWGVAAGPSNVALASAGAVASASSQFSSAFPASSTINGERAGVNWGKGGGWASSAAGAPEWLQVDFSGAKTIDHVIVSTVQDAWDSPSEPTDTMTFSRYGLVGFVVEGWDGAAWVTLGTVTSNNLVKRTVSFPPFTSSRVRVRVTQTVDGWSRIVELEAWGVAAGPSNVALASTGAAASASSELSSGFAASGAINGERAGLHWGEGGGWASRTSSGAEWLQVDFAGAKSIDRVVVYTVQDAWDSPSEPNDTMTFSRYGLVDFVVEGWNGAGWVTLGTVAGNNLVKRTVSFAPFTTSRIRVRVVSSVDGWSRLVELEAWGS